MSLLGNVCLHLETSGADADGKAICLACGAPVQVELTVGCLREAAEAIRRDFGRYGRHSRRCVETDEGWVCASDCRMMK